MIIIPKLSLASKSHSDFDTYASDIIDALNSNPNFPVTEPSMQVVAAKYGEYHTALMAAIGGTSQQIVLRNQLRKELHVLLTDLAFDVASRSGGNLALYLTSGFDYRRPPTPLNNLNEITDYQLYYNNNEEELGSRHSKIEGAVLYEVWVGTVPALPVDVINAHNLEQSSSTPSEPVPPAPPAPTPSPTPNPLTSTWWKAGEPSATTFIITGLTSGTRYYSFAVAKGKKNMKSDPSNVATKICP